MINQNSLEKIKEISQEFFQKMDLGIAAEVKNPEDLSVSVNLTMEEPQILIGEGGQTLAEVQKLLKLVLRKRIGGQDSFYLNLDINDYKKKKAEYLKEIARSAADEVVLTKKEKELPAMTAFERRVVHVELASRNDVAAESLGEEPNRRIIIKYHL